MDGEKAEGHLVALVEKGEFRHSEWVGKKFGSLKLASSTEKGNIGEDFLAALLREMGRVDVEVVKGRRGEYDVGVGAVKFEVKVATLDVHGSFQFNGVRYDTKYTHLFFLGVLPESLRYEIVAKQTLGDGGYTMVAMAKGTNSSFKVTLPEKRMKSFDRFEAEVRRLLGGV